MKNHRDYIAEQIKKKPSFSEDLKKAEWDVTIAIELAKLRERRGLSQARLADLAGMKQPQIARLESGAYMPSFSTLVRLLAALEGKLELSQTECRVMPTTKKVAVLR